MCKENLKCNAWISLHSVGIEAEGCLKVPSWIPALKTSHIGYCYILLPNRSLTCVKVIANGQFGYIELGIYEVNSVKKDVYIKRPILSQNLMYEACIQKLVNESLTSVGFPLGAPPVVSIFALADDSVCFAMEPIAGAVTLNKFLNNTGNVTGVIVECLLQLCAMLAHLGTHLGINHRDLKPSNFLIVEHEPCMKQFTIDNEQIVVESRYTLTIIDFGFACLGSSEGTHLSLSTVYSPTDICPKEGRDLFLFLGLLYLDYHAKLDKTLLKLFESWIDINLCAFMQKDKVYSMQWLYFMAGSDSIQKFKSQPLRIWHDLLNVTV